MPAHTAVLMVDFTTLNLMPPVGQPEQYCTDCIITEAVDNGWEYFDFLCSDESRSGDYHFLLQVDVAFLSPHSFFFILPGPLSFGIFRYFLIISNACGYDKYNMLYYLPMAVRINLNAGIPPGCLLSYPDITKWLSSYIFMLRITVMAFVTPMLRMSRGASPTN
jgi:hypothetical protein